MRIDIHTHFMPPALKENREFFADEPFWQYLVEPRGGKSIQGWVGVEQMLKDMDDAGIDKAIIQGEYFQTHAACIRKNDLAIEVIERAGDRLGAFAAIQPKAGQAALDELTRCLDHGFLGVGEICPYAQGFSFSDPDLFRIAEKCIENDVTLLLHANDEVGRFYKGKVPTPLRHYYDFAERFPDLKIVLAHWGGGLCFYELVPHVRKVLTNVRYDTAASPLIYPTDSIFRAALACLAPTKVLYGSDYPLTLYPRDQTAPDFSTFVQEIKGLGLGDQIEEGVFGGNARSILKEPAKKQGNRAPTSTHRTGHVASLNKEMSVSFIANAFPATRDVFDRKGIPWMEQSVSPWEPLEQVACAHGLKQAETDVLVAELNEAIRMSREQ